MERTTPYLGAFGCNESPEDLGGERRFWQFEDFEALERAYQTSRGLNEVFHELGAFIESRLIWAVDHQSFTLFHLLVLSKQGNLYGRQFELLEAAVAWLRTQGYPDLDPATIGIAGTSRPIHARQMQELAERRVEADARIATWQAERERADAERRAQKEKEQAELRDWEAAIDEEDRLRPYRKRDILDRLCQHFDLTPAKWIPLPPNWEALEPDWAAAAKELERGTMTDEECWEHYATPWLKQFYAESDRIIGPLVARFGINDDWIDRYALSGLEELYEALMMAIGQPADLPWRDE